MQHKKQNVRIVEFLPPRLLYNYDVTILGYKKYLPKNVVA